jgi:hypothetical protein
MEISPSCTCNFGCRRPPGTSVELIGKHAIHVNLALRGLDRKLFLHATTTASHDSTLLIPVYFNPYGFLTALRAREKSRQAFLWDVNDFSSSPPHFSVSFYALESTVLQYFMFAFKNVGIMRVKSLYFVMVGQ